MVKRSRSSSRSRFSKRARVTKRAPKRKMSRGKFTTSKRLRRIERMIETKEGCRKTSVNVQMPHNNVHIVLDSSGAVWNPFKLDQANSDPMLPNQGSRIGDSITVKGISIRAFFENALGRAKVYYRVMVIRAAKGDVVDRSTLFKGDADNKMIDQINTERFSIVAQKIFNISCTNPAPSSVIPGIQGVPTAGTPAGIGTKTFKMWIPGRKFGRNGIVQYENSSYQVKFYDYRLVIVPYDWYGTPQDVNNVGVINEMYSKIYFKDA